MNQRRQRATVAVMAAADGRQVRREDGLAGVRDPRPTCSSNPDAWFPEQNAGPRSQANRHALDGCVRCPIRSSCARLALDDPTHLTGIWAGVYVPPPGHQHTARTHALNRLRSIGFPATREDSADALTAV
ncbi:WhiB family redox-sensing transcriptional regulator [Gordonia terrae]